MKKNFKLFISSAIVAFSFSMCLIHHPSQAMEKEEKVAITLILSSKDWLLQKVNPKQNLAEYRNALKLNDGKKTLIEPEAVFQKDEAYIPLGEEKNWLLEEVIKDNTISFKEPPKRKILDDERSKIQNTNKRIKESIIYLPIPVIAQGYEKIYEQFWKGELVYRPNPTNDDGLIRLKISELKDPLEGKFDLSKCGNTGKYLSISTGYRKQQNPNNEGKIEVWFAPRFLIEKELNSTASHFKEIFRKWESSAQVGIFWTWGTEEIPPYGYVITQHRSNLSFNNLYEKWKDSELCGISEQERDCNYPWVHYEPIQLKYFSIEFLELK